MDTAVDVQLLTHTPDPIRVMYVAFRTCYSKFTPQQIWADIESGKISEEKTKWYLEQLTKNGMTVAPPSPALAGDLKKIGDTMTADWIKQAGPDGQAIVDAYKKM